MSADENYPLKREAKSALQEAVEVFRIPIVVFSAVKNKKAFFDDEYVPLNFQPTESPIHPLYLLDSEQQTGTYTMLVHQKQYKLRQILEKRNAKIR